MKMFWNIWPLIGSQLATMPLL